MADLGNYLTQLQDFRASDQARDNLVNDLVEKFKHLSEEHANLKNDYESERAIRRNYQKAVDEHKRDALEVTRQWEACSFVLALIDGDGAIFQDVLLQASAGDGGSEAASRLNHAIRDHVASLHSNSDNWPVMVHIYLSLDKLAMKLAQVGLLRSPTELRMFAQRFSINQPLFSIIDVGQGKERADHKIKEMLRTFIDNPTCRHIVFGGCHDGGYLTILDQFKQVEKKASRITLLETTPMYRDFANLTLFKRARFETVFRSEPLPESGNVANNNFALVSQARADTPPLQRATTNNSLRQPPMSPTTSNGTPPSSVAGETEGDSWATVGSNESISIGSNNKSKKKKKYAYYNKEEQRLDEPLPPRDPNAAASLEDRVRRVGKKMCNQYHLRGNCENGRFCQFQHEPKLTAAEANALMYKARSLACKNRYCENVDCYLGHQCAHERDCGTCNFQGTCHFRDTHGMDKVKYVRYDREGNAEYSKP